MFEEQKKTWPLMHNNYHSLNEVIERTFEFDDFVIKLQHNPARANSTLAKIDDNTIRNRKCFLCLANLTSEQIKLQYNNNFYLLTNPYPIFKQHLTIVSQQHVNQEFNRCVDDFIQLSSDLNKYVVFYNGPQCGASAPDHLHFQAGEFGFMPIDYEFDNIGKKYKQLLMSGDDYSVGIINSLYIRQLLFIESTQLNTILKYLQKVILTLHKVVPSETEPMVNILCYYKQPVYRIIIFPRALHRPWQFFTVGNKSIKISPGAVDMGGVLILPQLIDFEKITKDDIRDIFSQVSISDEQMQIFKNELVTNISL